MERFTGTWRLVRLALRRDRYMLPIWCLVIFAWTASVALSMLDLYPDAAARAGSAENRVTLPMISVLYGPLAGESLGHIAVHESYMFQALLVMIVTIACVIRHTRQNEETGRSEMLLSGILGRYALLTSALIAAVITCVGILIASTLGMVVYGFGFVGSLAGALGLAGVGLAFAGVAAVAAQIPQSARGATGLALAMGGVAFLVRSAGDVNASVTDGGDGLSSQSSWLSWLSPLGWGQQVRAFEDERWWVLLLPVILLAVLCAVAFRLVDRRDDGRGLISAPPGPERAPARLLSSFGLAWRLQRGALITWSGVILVAGTMLGFVGAQGDDLASQGEQVAEAFALFAGGDTSADPRAVFFALMIMLFSTAIGAYTILAISLMRSEELGPLESVLAGSVTRGSWLSGHLVIAVSGATALVVLLGLTLGLVGGLASGDTGEIFVPTFVIAVQQIPAIFALAGFTVLVFALLPRWFTGTAWAGFAVFTTLLGLGVANALFEGDWQMPLGIPEWALGISPFVHTNVPATDAVTAPSLLALTGISLLMALVSLSAFRRRDLAVGGV